MRARVREENPLQKNDDGAKEKSQGNSQWISEAKPTNRS